MKTFRGDIIETVWLDLDDTLVDFKAASRSALLRVYDEERLSRFFYSPTRWISAYERHNYNLWQAYAHAEIDQATLRMDRFRLPLIEAEMVDEIARKISARLDDVYLAYLVEDSVLIPGAMQLVNWLNDNAFKIGVLSNGFNIVQQGKLQQTGLEEFIDILVLSDDIGVNKPDVRLFDYAMRQSAGTSPASQLMIGDNVHTDIAGAMAAGWNAILFDPTLPLLHTTGPGYEIVSHLDYIPSLFV